MSHMRGFTICTCPVASQEMIPIGARSTRSRSRASLAARACMPCSAWVRASRRSCPTTRWLRPIAATAVPMPEAKGVEGTTVAWITA